MNFGQYLEAASNLSGSYSISNPIARIATTTSRTWTDNGTGGAGTPGFGDFVVQCDLLLVDANGECGRMNSPTFGTSARTTAAIDPGILNGWSVRPADWQIGASIQQELMPRMSVEVGYFRRWLTNFTTTDNESLGAVDFDSFSFTAPADPRLPGGGGYVVSGLYNVTAAGFARAPSNNITSANKFGSQTQVYDGVLINFSARAAQGLTLQGGINTGKTVQDVCDVRSQLPELTNALTSPLNPNCRNDPGFITKVTGLASYMVPKVEVLIAATLRSDQGAPFVRRTTRRWAPLRRRPAACGRRSAASRRLPAAP